MVISVKFVLLHLLLSSREWLGTSCEMVTVTMTADTQVRGNRALIE